MSNLQNGVSLEFHGFNYSISEAPGEVELRYAQQATERCAAVLGLQAMNQDGWVMSETMKPDLALNLNDKGPGPLAFHGFPSFQDISGISMTLLVPSSLAMKFCT